MSVNKDNSNNHKNLGESIHILQMFYKNIFIITMETLNVKNAIMGLCNSYTFLIIFSQMTHEPKENSSKKLLLKDFKDVQSNKVMVMIRQFY